MDIAKEHEDFFNRWYNEEHIPELMSVPGILAASSNHVSYHRPVHFMFGNTNGCHLKERPTCRIRKPGRAFHEHNFFRTFLRSDVLHHHGRVFDSRVHQLFFIYEPTRCMRLFLRGCAARLAVL